ncbi:MAG: hypothetical protein M0R49_07090 [Limnochordia bacterium]|nr:hypothetical protein [Limnochordia bacterium]
MAHIPDEQLTQLIEDMSEIRTALKGYNGYPGLCESHRELAKDYYSFKRKSLLVFGFLTGAGILTGGSLGILQVLGG